MVKSSALVALPGARPSAFVALPGKRPSAFVALPGKRPSAFVALPGARPSAFVALPGARPSAFTGRSGERGATLFVVLLVIMLLMGIGILSARSAQLATQASGSERQMTQTRYVAEYGLMFATAKLSNGGAQAYMMAMRGTGNPPVAPPADVCFAQTVGPPAVPPDRTCYKMSAADISGELGFPVCDQMNSQGNASCDFTLELTDLSEGFTQPGFSLAHAKPLRFWFVTATATGQVLLSAGTTTALVESSGVQTVRSRILAGPFPAH